jgi:hypothetical protein
MARNMQEKLCFKPWTIAFFLVPFLIGSLTCVVWLSAYHGVGDIGNIDCTDLAVIILSCGIIGWFGGAWCGGMTALVVSWVMDSEPRRSVMVIYMVLFSALTSLAVLREMTRVHMTRSVPVKIEVLSNGKR